MHGGKRSSCLTLNSSLQLLTFIILQECLVRSPFSFLTSTYHAFQSSLPPHMPWLSSPSLHNLYFQLLPIPYSVPASHIPLLTLTPLPTTHIPYFQLSPIPCSAPAASRLAPLDLLTEVFHYRQIVHWAWWTRWSRRAEPDSRCAPPENVEGQIIYTEKRVHQISTTSDMFLALLWLEMTTEYLKIKIYYNSVFCVYLFH